MSGIDNLNTEKEIEKPKPSVAVRNNWAIINAMLDTSSESEEDAEKEVDTRVEDEEKEESSDDNDFILKKADAIEDYESGDSLDEEEREYLAKNEVKEAGIDLGSDDTDDSEDESDDESMDSFIVADTDAIANETDDEEVSDQNDRLRNSTRSFSRIVNPLSSTDDDENSREMLTVSMQNIQQVIVMDHGYSAAEQIVEGKKFETTVFQQDDANEEPMSTKKNPLIRQNADEDESNESFKSATDQSNDKLVATSAVVEAEETAAENATDKADEIKKENISADEPEAEKPAEDPANEQVEHAEEVQVHNESDLSTSSKENETASVNIPLKSGRRSLVEIGSLSKQSIESITGIKRKSLGDLLPNQQVLQVAPIHVQFPSKTDSENQCSSVHPEDKSVENTGSTSKNDSITCDEANTSSKSIDSKMPSSQEENNNKKQKAKKAEIVQAKKNAKKGKPAKHTFVEESLQDFEERNVRLQSVASTSSKPTATVTLADLEGRVKRTFTEIDTESVESYGEKKPRKKFLNIINTASGQFIEEPMTPEKKNKFGFIETPITPVNKAFQIQSIVKAKKRRSEHIEEPALTLPGPSWLVESKDESRPKKRQRIVHMGPTEVIIKSLQQPKRKKAARELIPVELVNFRKNNLYRNGIPRQDARELLLEKRKREAAKRNHK